MRFLYEVAIEEGVISVLDRDDGRIDIIGKRVDDLVVFRLSAEIFVDDIGTAGHGAHDLVELLLGIFPLEAVEYDHIGVLYLVEGELTHILVVGKEGRRIEEGHHLRDRPAFGHGVKKFLQQMHPVVFDDNAIRGIFIRKRCESCFAHLGGIERFHGIGRVGEFAVIVVLLPFLHDEQQRALARIEAGIFEGLLNELCLSRFQKTEKEIDGYVSHGVIRAAAIAACPLLSRSR